MYRRLFIISAIIFLALVAFGILGFHSISLHEEGLAGRRAVAFTDVAEQVRIDIKQKYDKFIQTEQKRPYTDYQYFYTPQALNADNGAIIRSPLAEKMAHGMAYGHFQIEPDGKIISPFYVEGLNQELTAEKQMYVTNIDYNIKNSLKGRPNSAAYLDIQRKALALEQYQKDNMSKGKGSYSQQKSFTKGQQVAQVPRQRNYYVNALDDEKNKIPQFYNQSRSVVNANITSNTAQGGGGVVWQSQQAAPQLAAPNPNEQQQLQPSDQDTGPDQQMQFNTPIVITPQEAEVQSIPQVQSDQQAEEITSAPYQQFVQQSANNAFGIQADQSQGLDDMVQIRVEPFVPITIKAGADDDSFFESQVFLLRHVQIEDNHILQGFKLNEKELVKQVEESARHLLREGMGFELSKTESPNTTHAAILDFGFGQIVLNLLELRPHWIADQVSYLKKWYFAIVSVVLIATVLAMASLWQSLHAQVCLARKKDDFISAVSHELRTPLTTIRMYTEMLEKNWIKNDGQHSEYYSTMRQESERLSRLIENVLDFSRIQRGRKTYHFDIGNINAAIEEVVDMMMPYATQQGFVLTKQFDKSLDTVSFDRDAIMQIVINLLDNAVKYARNAEDRRIVVRTGSENGFVIIEIEDHGPGIPHLQRKKIFDEFYRIGEEAKRETTGTGLGLALVKKFTQAHNGLVEVISAKPKGSIFRVALPRNS